MKITKQTAKIIAYVVSGAASATIGTALYNSCGKKDIISAIGSCCTGGVAGGMTGFEIYKMLCATIVDKTEDVTEGVEETTE